jgi:hypothetical protein
MEVAAHAAAGTGDDVFSADELAQWMMRGRVILVLS